MWYRFFFYFLIPLIAIFQKNLPTFVLIPEVYMIFQVIRKIVYKNKYLNKCRKKMILWEKQPSAEILIEDWHDSFISGA